MKPKPIAVAVHNPLLHPEALHIAAATGRPVVEVPDPAQLHRIQAFALLIDATLAPKHPPPTAPAFLISAEPDPAHPEAFTLPAQAADLLKALGALNLRRAPAAAPGRVVAVLGAAGGVGASTFAASLSCKAPDATLIDAHPRSGGLDLLLGIEEQPGARWGEIELGEGVIAREAVRRALPTTAGGVAVLTYTRATVADGLDIGAAEVETAVDALAAGGCTVLDVPVRAVPARCDLALVVVPPQLRAAASAARVVAELNARGVDHALVLRRSGWESLAADEVSRIAESRVVAHLPTCRGLTRQVERAGLPARLPRGLAAAADAALAELGFGQPGKSYGGAR